MIDLGRFGLRIGWPVVLCRGRDGRPGAYTNAFLSLSLSLSRTLVSKQGEYNKKSSQDLSSYFEA